MVSLRIYASRPSIAEVMRLERTIHQSQCLGQTVCVFARAPRDFVPPVRRQTAAWPSGDLGRVAELCTVFADPFQHCSNAFLWATRGHIA